MPHLFGGVAYPEALRQYLQLLLNPPNHITVSGPKATPADHLRLV